MLHMLLTINAIYTRRIITLKIINQHEWQSEG